MGSSSSYQIAGLAIALCLTLAGVITLLSAPLDTVSNTAGNSNGLSGGSNFSSPAIQPAGTGAASSHASRIRVLWYDPGSRTYTFRDYDRPGLPDPSAWKETDLPAPENGTLQRKAAMVRFLDWDGTMERMTGTRYLTDQETITGILNSYTLIAPPPPVEPALTPPPTAEPTPDITPAPGMLIPTMSQPCNQGDGTIRVAFGYTSRHNTPVSLPVGPSNRFTPGVPDRGQPTTFLPGVHENVFTVAIPADSTNLVWNLMNTAVEAGVVPVLKAEMLAEPAAGYAPLTVQFSDRSTGGTNENPLTGTWNLGDRTTAEGNAISHQYKTPGTYQISRIVRTDCGSDTSTGTIAVYEAAFSTEPVAGSPGTYRLTDRSTGNPETWFWDFSDGFTSWEQSPTHRWEKPGRYAVGLRVSGKNGTGTVVNTITI